MNPNQQPAPSPPPNAPQQPAGPPPANGGFYSQPMPQQPAPQPAPMSYAQQPQSFQQPQPQQPGYGPQPAPTYAVDYLDQIAPPPPRPKFFSGVFGKAFIGLMVVFVLAVSLIVAFGNQKRTADIENMAIRLDNMQKITKTTALNLKSSKLLATNSIYQVWIAGADTEAYDLLTKAEVKKNAIDKKMIADEKAKTTALSSKFDDARLNANLDYVYAREMAYQTQTLLTAFSTMSKKSQAAAIRDYAKRAVTNLTPIQKAFADFDASGV